MKLTAIVGAFLMVSTLTGTQLFAQGNRQNDPKPITIEIQAAQLLKAMRHGDEVSEYCSMEDGRNRGQMVSGQKLRNNETIVAPGQELVWDIKIKGPRKRVEIIDFDFEEQVGRNFFMIEGGYLPRKQDDGTYVATVSPNAEAGHKLKYTVMVLIDGKQFQIDPVVVVGSGGVGGDDGDGSGDGGGGE